MNELKFNSQICTTKEQSQRLLELGLKPETADMSHQYIEAEWEWFILPCNWNSCTISEDLIPAWSLHRLMEIAEMDCFNSVATAYDEVIIVIKFQHGEGYINKEYLKQ